MNYTEIIKELVSGVIESIRKEIVTASFDKTFKAKVEGKISEGKYQILYKGKKYYATCDTSLSTGEIVKVCAPQNNWSELFIMTFGTGGSGGTVVSGVSGVKGSAESTFRNGDVIISPENIGLGKVENKTSEDIRNEITSQNITNALGYSPIDSSSEEYNNIKLNSHTHENKEALDDITKEMVTTLGEIVEEGFKITVDTELSDESENPLQNKVVTSELSKKVDKTRMINGKNLSSDINLTSTDVGAIDISLKGKENGVAELDENGKVVSTQIPSEFKNIVDGYYYNNNFYIDSSYENEIIGEDEKLYVDLLSNKIFRWNGSNYIETYYLSLGETSTTAFQGDKGKIAYDHSQSEHAPSNAERNIIIGIKKNGVDLNADSDRKVDIEIPVYGIVSSEEDGLMSSEDKQKLDGIEDNANNYVHPDYTSKELGFYKLTVDNTGHVSQVEMVNKDDITKLGIPGQDTTYENATSEESGLMSSLDKIKLDSIEEGANKTIIDSELNESSVNPVQNKVIKKALDNKIDEINADIKYALKSHGHNISEITDMPTKLSEFNNDMGFITNTVNNLTNYYTKNTTYTKDEVNSLINGIVTLNILVVDSLPLDNISLSTIYLLPKEDFNDNDIYDEYINTDGTSNGWELIGTTKVDLSDYYTKTQTDNLLLNKVDKIDGKQLSTNDFTNIYKTNVDDNTNARHTHDNKTLLDDIENSDIENWNNKLSSDDNASNVTVDFSESSTLSNIITGESLKIIMGKISKAISDIISHIGNKSNPHNVTKSQIGLGNVENFKAVSTVSNQGLTTTEQSNARANIGAGTSNFSGNYNDLINKPTIPTVNNATLTIQKNGVNVGNFTANASENKNINIVVPTKTSELTNDSGFKTTDNNTTYTLTKDGSKIILTGSDGKTTSIDDSDTTYTLNSFGITATADEINKLDGVTVTTEEINYLDGVTSNVQTQLNNKLGTSDNAASATKLETARNINGLSFDGTANRVNYGTCSTAAATAAKVVSCSGFSLITGSEITVKFTVTNIASNPTLNVNSTGAKAIYYNGSAISAGYLKANKTYSFRYNGTQYDLVGDIDTNTTYSLSSFGVTATAEELNKLDGCVVTTEELNYLDGVKSNIQTQLNEKANSLHNHDASNIISGTFDITRIPSIPDDKITEVSASKISGIISSSNLPSYVDDVLEYNEKSSFPTIGETGKIYVDTSTNKTYRWSGTSYVEISASLALGTTSSTAFRGDYGNIAYTHAIAKGNAYSSGLYKITTNDQGHVIGATEVTKSDITALGIPDSDTDTTYTEATDSILGLVKIGYEENDKNYPVELDNGQMFVNVPWTDTDTTYEVATEDSDGLLSFTDKQKLDNIEDNANNYIHPTTSGNKHIPSGGSEGQILRWDSDGTAKWDAQNLDSDLTNKIVLVEFDVNNWTSTEEYFTQKINLEELRSDVRYILVKSNESKDSDITNEYNKNFSIISNGFGNVSNGSMTWTCFKKPSSNIIVGLQYVAEIVKEYAEGAVSADHISLTKAEYEALLESNEIDDSAYYFITDDEEILPEKIMSGYVYVDEEAIETPVEEILLDADKLGGELPEAYVKKVDVSNEQVNDESKIPTSALVYGMSENISNNNENIDSLIKETTIENITDKIHISDSLTNIGYYGFRQGKVCFLSFKFKKPEGTLHNLIAYSLDSDLKPISSTFYGIASNFNTGVAYQFGIENTNNGQLRFYSIPTNSNYTANEEVQGNMTWICV